jgi:hypothetical protein
VDEVIGVGAEELAARGRTRSPMRIIASATLRGSPGMASSGTLLLPWVKSAAWVPAYAGRCEGAMSADP